MSSLGVYISIPFCKAKCTFCNFASDAFAPGRMESYTESLCREIEGAPQRAARLGALLPRRVDTIYFGGGTPSLLEPGQMRRIFAQLHATFQIEPDAEITLECAPGQLSAGLLEELLRQGMNRISFGVQSFVDSESAAVGRLHTRQMCLSELARARAAGLADINIDLIAGLPLQTEASWRYSVEQAIATDSTHVSVYMLEVDEASRLGREALVLGTRYHAAQLPSDDETARWYEIACELLEQAGLAQYEISNFARPGFQSRHNLKYWRRQPYVGFGLDAHSMLASPEAAMRLANSDDLDTYLGGAGPFHLVQPTPQPDVIGNEAAFEEALFLGLRLNEGVSVGDLRAAYGDSLLDDAMPALRDLQDAGLVRIVGGRIRLTARGRLLSNEVFSRILIATPA